jgi:hypothetical protein
MTTIDGGPAHIEVLIETFTSSFEEVLSIVRFSSMSLSDG